MYLAAWLPNRSCAHARRLEPATLAGSSARCNAVASGSRSKHGIVSRFCAPRTPRSLTGSSIRGCARPWWRARAPRASPTLASTSPAPTSVRDETKTSRAMRLFIAVNLPAAVRDAIYADAEPLRAATNAIRWVSPAALHVTLKFLGEQDESLVAPLRDVLEAVVPTHAAISVRTTEVGAFPNFRRPRVVWVGMTSERALQSLAGDIDRALTPLGIPREARPFQAHLTLGRVKSELPPADATNLAAA